RKELIIKLRKEGLLNLRKSMDTVAQHPGVSRATAYLYARQSDCELCPSQAGLSVSVLFSLTLVFQFFRELLMRLLAFCPVTHCVI
ncbi:helix-turn-helix domain-containing protein, partial [Salmonella enterica]|uniref:helix-turn-helix domain-containing protein n=1 Tax=Salmonella enterica TaxID=28901 RepID=UPI001FAF49EF